MSLHNKLSLMEMLYEVKERRFEAIKQIRRHNRGFQDFDTTVT